jgi:hypothetical protein
MQIGTRQHDTAHSGIAADHGFDQYVFVLELKSYIGERVRSGNNIRKSLRLGQSRKLKSQRGATVGCRFGAAVSC